jgi:hypothetical protein
LVFGIEQIDTLQRAGARNASEGFYLVLVGRLENPTGERVTIKGSELGLLVDGTEYELKGEASRSLKSEYDDRDFPGYFQGQSIDAGESEPTFMLFDVPRAEHVMLVFDGEPVVGLTLAFAGDEREVGFTLAIPTAVPIVIPDPTHTSLPPATPRPTTTPSPVVNVSASSGAVNLRGGPGTNYQIVGALDQNETLQAYGRNTTGDWVTTEDGREWVATWVVEIEGDVSALPVVAAPPVPTAAWVPPTWTPALAQPQVQPTAAPVDNCPQRLCSSFASCDEVRAYLAACPQWTSDLDWDNDGVPCNDLCGSSGEQQPPPAPTQQPALPPSDEWTGGCGSYQACTTFSSCAEVHAFLNACPQYWGRADGNGDGVPCENLCR